MGEGHTFDWRVTVREFEHLPPNNESKSRSCYFQQEVLAFPGPAAGAGKRHPGGGHALSGQLRGPLLAVQLRQNLLSSLFPNLENEGVE